MSSTSNVQDLLVNVFRPTYQWQAGTGFVPSLTISNVSEIIATRIKAEQLAISDANANTYIGSNAGVGATTTASNVAIGYQAMGAASNSSNNVAIGVFSLDGVGFSDSNVAIGDRTDITGRGLKNVLIGPNVTMGDGSYNILIGSDISLGSGNYRFQLGTLLYGDLSSNRVGILTSAPEVDVDISGMTVFRNKVGIQTTSPNYSLDVNGSIYASQRLIVGPGSVATPIYGFKDLSSGLYQATDVSYGTGAVGVSVNSVERVVVASNKTYIYGGLDVCGTVTSSGGSASFLAGPGSVSEPAYSFSGTSNLGLYRTTDASGTAVGIAIGGTSRFVVGSNKVTIIGNMDVCGAFSAVSGGGGGGGGGTIAANGSAAAPSFTFSNDSTTGLFLLASNKIGVSTGGVLRVCISGSLVGVGTSTPQFGIDVSGAGVQKIQVSGQDAAVNIRDQRTTDPFVVFQNNNNQGFFASNALPVWMYQSNAVRMVLSNGNVGIGTTAPTSTLDVSGVATLCNTVVSGALRNALTPTTYDISGGNISNSATTRSSNFIGTASASNQIGGVTLSTSNVLTGGGLRGTPALSVGDVSSGFFRESANSLTVSIAGVKTANFSNNIIEFSNSGIQTLWLSNNQLQSTGGSVSTPAYSFAVDTSTGFYRIASGSVGFGTAGLRRIVFSNSNIGVGRDPIVDPSMVLITNPNAYISAGRLYLGDPANTSPAFGSAFIEGLSNGGSGACDLIFSSRAAGTGAGTDPRERMRIVGQGGNIGIGTSTPAYTLDICASAGTPSVNITTWPRIPLSNALMVKGVPGAPVGNTLNFNTTVRSINSTLATWVASNATSGSSLLINKAGIWSIMVVGSTGNGTQLWMDVSTGNHSNIGVYTNGNPVLAVAFTPGTGTSNNTTCTFMGYIPSNVYVKPRINGTLGADGDVVWRLNALFHAETDATTTWPF